MRVLLVYSNPNRDLLPAPPIGLSYVASATVRAGHDVRVVDLSGAARPRERVARDVADFAPDVVGISVRNIDNVVRQKLEGHLDPLAGLIAAIRAACPDRRLPVVIGGPAVSILRETALEHLDADYAVLGEGERAFPALLAAIAEGAAPEGVPNLAFRRDGSIVCTAAQHLAEFGPSGMADWIDWPAYARRGGTWAIQTKRGCPMPCSYCTYPVIEGRRLRCRPAGEVVDEIEEVVRRLAPRTIDVIDSTFNVPLDHALGICREIVRRRLRLNLTTMGVNPLQVTAELFEWMERAGFNSMMITPEAASPAMLESLRKGFTLEHVRRTAELARASRMASMWFFMLGGPGETMETVEQTVSFAERELAGPRQLTVFFTGVRVLPGTELARQAVALGTLAPDTDLAKPVFYLSPAIDETRVLDRINAAIRRHPNIVHAAEEGTTAASRLFHRALHLAGVAPPYWRFLPRFLATPPLRLLRSRYPTVGTGGRLAAVPSVGRQITT
jgi:radical SAM superfamily enzyme YgiQ (UPF0313 family)